MKKVIEQLESLYEEMLVAPKAQYFWRQRVLDIWDSAKALETQNSEVKPEPAVSVSECRDADLERCLCIVEDYRFALGFKAGWNAAHPIPGEPRHGIEKPSHTEFIPAYRAIKARLGISVASQSAPQGDSTNTPQPPPGEANSVVRKIGTTEVPVTDTPKVGTWVGEGVWQCGCTIRGNPCHNGAYVEMCDACGYSRPSLQGPEPKSEPFNGPGICQVHRTRVKVNSTGTGYKPCALCYPDLGDGDSQQQSKPEVSRSEQVSPKSGESFEEIDAAFVSGLHSQVRRMGQSLLEMHGKVGRLESRLSRLEAAHPEAIPDVEKGPFVYASGYSTTAHAERPVSENLEVAHSEAIKDAGLSENAAHVQSPEKTTVSTPLVEPGEGWRRLSDDEVIREGDEFNWSDWIERGRCDAWATVGPNDKEIGWSVGSVTVGGNSLLVFRRRIEPSLPFKKEPGYLYIITDEGKREHGPKLPTDEYWSAAGQWFKVDAAWQTKPGVFTAEFYRRKLPLQESKPQVWEALVQETPISPRNLGLAFYEDVPAVKHQKVWVSLSKPVAFESEQVRSKSKSSNEPEVGDKRNVDR